ncbi:hypothetical protein M3J09_013754 [Ascochyta lentis]
MHHSVIHLLSNNFFDSKIYSIPDLISAWNSSMRNSRPGICLVLHFYDRSTGMGLQS